MATLSTPQNESQQKPGVGTRCYIFFKCNIVFIADEHKDEHKKPTKEQSLKRKYCKINKQSKTSVHCLFIETKDQKYSTDPDPILIECEMQKTSVHSVDYVTIIGMVSKL